MTPLKRTLGWRDPNSTPQYQGTRRTESYQGSDLSKFAREKLSKCHYWSFYSWIQITTLCCEVCNSLSSPCNVRGHGWRRGEIQPQRIKELRFSCIHVLVVRYHGNDRCDKLSPWLHGVRSYKGDEMKKRAGNLREQGGFSGSSEDLLNRSPQC
ncbi:unnamed protein product [Lepidochelys kempii]